MKWLSTITLTAEIEAENEEAAMEALADVPHDLVDCKLEAFVDVVAEPVKE